MTIAEFDNLEEEKKRKLLTLCCGSQAWVEKMIAALPAEDLVDLEELAEEKWYECSREDWLEAFSHHPKIGDISTLREKFKHTADWAENEQSGVREAPDRVLLDLAEANEAYEKKFGYIFIVCATGKSATEMLDILRSRLNNDPAEELENAAEEQDKITKIRLEKLFI